MARRNEKGPVCPGSEGRGHWIWALNMCVQVCRSLERSRKFENLGLWTFYSILMLHRLYHIYYICYVFQSRCMPTSFFSGLPRQWFTDCSRSSSYRETSKNVNYVRIVSSKFVFLSKQFFHRLQQFCLIHALSFIASGPYFIFSICWMNKYYL